MSSARKALDFCEQVQAPMSSIFSPNRLNNTQARVLCAILVAIFAFFLISDLMIWRKARASADWPTTKATVTTSSLHWVSTSKGHCQALNLQYSYKIGDTIYHNDRYMFGQGVCDKLADAEIAAQHPVGSVLQIRYSPENAEDSVVVSGRVSGVTIFAVCFFSILIILLGIWIVRPDIFKPKGRFNYGDVRRYYRRDAEVVRKLRENPAAVQAIRQDPIMAEAVMKDKSVLDDIIAGTYRSPE